MTISNPNSKIFRTVIRNDDYIVRDHQLHGTRVLPGVTLIDLAHRALQASRLSPDEFELQNLHFIEPIATSEETDQAVEVRITGLGDDTKVRIFSKREGRGADLGEDWRKTFQADVRLRRDTTPEKVELRELLAASVRRIDLAEVYSGARSLEIRHFEFMTSHGTVHEGDHFVLAEVYLSDLAKQHSEDFFIHPVYMDIATGIPFFVRASSNTVTKPYIPIYIESFRAIKKLFDPVFIYTARAHQHDGIRDVLSDDIKIYDASGCLAVSMKALKLKQVRAERLITDLVQNANANVSQRQPIVPEASNTRNSSDPGFVANKRREQTFADELRAIIANALKQNAAEIRIDIGFYDLGLDSANLINLVSVLEAKVKRQLYPTLLFEYPTIEALSKYLAQECDEACATKENTRSHESVSAQESVRAELPRTSLYLPCWVEQESGNTSSLHGTPVIHSESLPLIVFDRDKELFNSLNSRMGTRADEQSASVLVKPGGRFRKERTNVFEVCTGEEDDYKRLFAALEGDGIHPRTVVINLKANEEAGRLACSDGLESRLELARTRVKGGVESLFCLIRVFREKIRAKISTLVLYDGNDAPEIGALAGFFKTVGLEMPQFDGRLIRISGNEPNSEALAAVVCRELSQVSSLSRSVLYRGERRHIEMLKAASPEQANSELRSVLRHRGTYLITGGSGGLGFLVAKKLAADYHARLILIGRSSLSAAQREEIEQVSASGGSAFYMQADVTSYEEMDSCLREAKSRIGAINGVIHCAGVIDDGLLINKQQAALNRVLAPKITGTLVVDHVCRNEPLDFFVMFSSISATFGSVGQCDYAFANAFMDGYAEERENLRNRGQRSGFSCSINWPLWESTGMHVSQETEEDKLRRFGLEVLPPAEGLTAFTKIVDLEMRRPIVIHGYADRYASKLGIEKAAHHVRQLNGAETLPQADLTPSPGASAVAAWDEKVAPEQHLSKEPIAIIGVAGRYPSGEDLEKFWRTLRDGHDAITEIPSERWNHAEYYDSERGKKGKTYSKWGGFLHDIDKFDPLFFNLSPLEAEMMDPQERLFLETAWSVIEDAGYTPQTLCRSRDGESNGKDVGIFAGVMWSDYQLYGHEESLAGNHVFANSWFSMIPNRVSYLFDFQGPSLPVDTACSSSLVAVHLACESIRKGECSVAIAGGVNLSLHPSKYVKTSQLQMHSTDGRCRSFGKGGDGYVPGEGVGAVLLKPLHRALDDGDHVYAVIKGTAVRHGGRTSGFAVPSPSAQACLITANLANSGVEQASISYVEAHGTGTSLGDPIEIQGLKQAFASRTAGRQLCPVGSVKSNIGHLEAAAGIAALTKVLLQLKHKRIVPTLHSTAPNPAIDFENSPFYLPQTSEPWVRPQVVINGRTIIYPRRAAISSFGAGGVNAHTIIEEYEAASGRKSDRGEAALFVFSAKNEAQLKECCRRFKSYLEDLDTRQGILPGDSIISQDDNGTSNLEDIAYTLQVGRVAMEKRLAIIASSRKQLHETLTDFLNGRSGTNVFAGSAKTSEGVLEVLKTSPEAEVFIKSLVDHQEWSNLAKFWVNGLDIDWHALHEGKARHRCPLPTYPFARQRYWLSTTIHTSIRVRHAENLENPGEKESPRPQNESSQNPELPEDVVKAQPTTGIVSEWLVQEELTGSPSQAQCESYLTELISIEIKLPAGEIDPTESILNYGLDSVVLMKLKAALEERYGELPVMLFFEYKTVRELAGYLIANCSESSAEAQFVCEAAD